MSRVSTEGKTMEEKMAMADEISRNYFKKGLNCAECVFRTFADMHDINFPDEVIALTTGLGGGIGQQKSACGAITGAVMALGTVKGRRNPFEYEETSDRIKQLYGNVYPIFKEMTEEMKEHCGTLICSELSAPHGDFEGKARKKNCMEMIGYCSSIVTKYADK